MTTVRLDGAYDSGTNGDFTQTWTWFDLSEPDCFHHALDFPDALARLQNPYDEFIDAVNKDRVSFAQAVAYGHNLGRVITEHPLWDDFPSIEQEYRIAELSDDVLTFCVYEPRTLDSPADVKSQILRYTFDVQLLAVVTRDVLAAVKFR